MQSVSSHFNLERQYKDLFDAYIRLTVSYFYTRTDLELNELYLSLKEQFTPDSIEQVVEIKGEKYKFDFFFDKTKK